MENKISEFDLMVYKKIRNNVNAFLKTQAGIYDSDLVKLLDIAPQVHAGAKQFFKKSQIFTADIDEKSGADYIIDICKNNEHDIPSSTFDIIVCTEVLELTLNPFFAIEEIYRLLKTGGILLMTTPFDFRIHGPLPDCWRFTEHGIRALLNKFQILEINPLNNDDRFLMPYHYTTVAKK
jgi:SAM-dependent methyltransferase